MTVNSMTNVTNPTIYGPQTHAIVLNHMDVVELRVVNWDAGKHPCKLSLPRPKTKPGGSRLD